jgi:hypothetical protein
MIKINNKFEIGQEVYYIGKKCMQYGKKKKFKWVVKSKKPVKILCIYYKHKLFGDPELLYNVEPYGKAREERLFVDYESARSECEKRNKEENIQIGGTEN